MAVAKELNALLGKLAKNSPEKPVTLSYPGFLGSAEWDEPAVVETKQNIFIVPKAAEARIEADHTPEQVAQMIQESYDTYQQQQQGDAS